MSLADTLHLAVERYGLIAVFIGCVAEGESAAVLAGFFAHQHVFPLDRAVLATFAGAFLGDIGFFLTGRHFAGYEMVRRLTRRPGFSHALDLVAKRPTAYVILNRYAYGFRLAGGIAAGLSTLPFGKFVVLNAISSIIWTVLFLSIGYVFGASAERILGDELARHQRLLVGLAIGVAVAIVAGLVAHSLARRARSKRVQ